MNYKETVDSIFNGNYGGIVLASNDVDGLSKEIIDNLFSEECNVGRKTKIDNLLIYLNSLDKSSEDEVCNIIIKVGKNVKVITAISKSYEWLNFIGVGGLQCPY